MWFILGEVCIMSQRLRFIVIIIFVVIGIGLVYNIGFSTSL